MLQTLSLYYKKIHFDQLSHSKMDLMSEQIIPLKQSDLEETQKLQVKQTIRLQKKFAVFSQAYPSLENGQPLYQTIRQKSPSDSSVGEQKRLLKPEVKSEIHSKLARINFTAESHNQPILIRQVEMSDLKELRNLQDEWFPIHYTDDFYKKIIRKDCYCLVAETVIKIPQKNDPSNTSEKEQKVIVGAAVFELTDSEGYAYKSWTDMFIDWFRTPEDSIYIMTLGVIDEFRKKGVGKLLIESILEAANEWKQVKLIYLHVIAYNNAAINFYKRIGFSMLENLENFYHLGGKEFDGQVYGMFVNGGKNNSKWSLWLKKLFR